MKKKVLPLLLTASMVASMFSVPVYASPFGDVQGHWGEKAIERWSGYNIVNGSDGQFRPNDSLTRGELAVIIANLLKLDKTAENPFSDLGQTWYTDAILKCYAAGIFSGDEAGTVRPNDNITREEAMVVLSKALRIAPVSGDVEGFADSGAVSNWAEGAVKALLEAGIVSGVSEDFLQPKGLINRASVVTILNNAIGTYVAQEGETVTANGGMVLVVGKDVTVTGTADTVLILDGAADSKVELEDLQVKDTVIVESPKTEVVLIGDTKTADIQVKADADDVTVMVTKDAEAGTIATSAENTEIIVDGKAESIVAEETATGSKMTVGKDAEVGTVSTEAEKTEVLVEGKADRVEVKENAKESVVKVEADGKVETVKTEAEKTEINVSGKVEEVEIHETADKTEVKVDATGKVETVDTEAEDVTVSGKGEVTKVEASGDNTAVTTPDTKVEAAEGTNGVTAGNNKVKGGETATTTPSTGGSSGSGGGSGSSSHKHRYGEETVDETTGVGYQECSCGNKIETGNVYEAKADKLYYKTLEEAFAAGEEVKLLHDVVLEGEVPALNTSGRTMTVELNGKKITVPNDTDGSGVFCIPKGGNLTLNDSAGTAVVDGASQHNDYGMAVWAPGGTVTINGGTYTNKGTKAFEDNNKTPNNNEVIYASEGGTVTINGGTFIGNEELNQNGTKYMLNLKDNSGSQIIVKGGTFHKYNPSQSESETPTANFVAEGYYVHQKGDIYTVDNQWDSSVVDTSWYNADKSSFEIKNAAQLAGLAKLVNNGTDNFKGKTITLTADIDLNNQNWTPIGRNNAFEGVFDGQNHTISNLYIDISQNRAGLFGYTQNGELKDLNIHNADVTGVNAVGAFVGEPYTSKMNDLHLTGSVEINGNWYVGALLGYNSYANLIDFTVKADKGSYVKGTGAYVGGIIGFHGENSFVMKNCVVENLDISGWSYVGGISGICQYGNTIEDCRVIANVTKTITPEENPDNSDTHGVGAIAGITVDDKELCTIKNCVFEGTVTSYWEFLHDGIVGCSRGGIQEQKNLILENNDMTKAELKVIGQSSVEEIIPETQEADGLESEQAENDTDVIPNDATEQENEESKDADVVDTNSPATEDADTNDADTNDAVTEDVTVEEENTENMKTPEGEAA